MDKKSIREKYWSIVWEEIKTAAWEESGMKTSILSFFVVIFYGVVFSILYVTKVISINFFNSIGANILFEVVTILIPTTVFLLLLVGALSYVPAKIHDKQEKDIADLKMRYESENPNIRVEEFNSAEKKTSGITIYNDNQNNDIIDISVTLVAMVEHKIDESYKEVGQIIYSFDDDNCHFEKWTNGKNTVTVNDKNVLYFAGLNGSKEHLFLEKGFDLENHSAPFVSSKNKEVLFGRYDLYFDIAGKMDRSPKKPFKQSFRGELGFTRNIESFVDAEVLDLKDEIVFSMNNIIQIVDSRKPLAVVLANH